MRRQPIISPLPHDALCSLIATTTAAITASPDIQTITHDWVGSMIHSCGGGGDNGCCLEQCRQAQHAVGTERRSSLPRHLCYLCSPREVTVTGEQPRGSELHQPAVQPAVRP